MAFKYFLFKKEDTWLKMHQIFKDYILQLFEVNHITETKPSCVRPKGCYVVGSAAFGLKWDSASLVEPVLLFTWLCSLSLC